MLLMVAGCSDETGGTAVPEATGGSPTGEAPPPLPTGGGGSTGTTGTETADSPLAGVDPCSLMTDQAAAAVGIDDISAGQTEDVGSAENCVWQVEKATAAESYDVVLSVYADVGLKDLPDDIDKQPITVGDREAVRSLGDFSCSVLIFVTDSSHVAAQVAGDGDEGDCTIALELAKLVEPELPEG